MFSTIARRLRRTTFFAPIYGRHYLLNGIGHACRVTDAVFQTNLSERFRQARTAAVVNTTLEGSSLNVRSVFKNFRNP